MTTQTTTDRKLLPGKFVWFEHVSGESRKAQAFYREVLGWKVQAWGDTGYDMILAGDDADSMIGGYVTSEKDREPSRWLSYVSVENVDKAAELVAAAGGRVIEAAHDLPGVGRAARVADPEGAELYLFRNASGDPEDRERAPIRTFFWNELHAKDPKRALSFYEKVLGFTHEAKEMGPGDTYYVLSRNGVGRGGVTGHLPAGMPAHWLPYVNVDDPDAVLARAKAGGGKIHVEARDIPGIGRFGVLEDPTGAALAVMKPMPMGK